MSFVPSVGRNDQASSDRATIATLPNVLATRLYARDRWFGYGAWFVLFAAVSVLLAMGNQRTVTPSYWGAAHNWLSGEPLYDGTGRGFIYLPQSAVLFIPFSLLPPLLCEIVWRLISLGGFAWGLERLAVTGERRFARPLFGMATLIAIPIAATCARNGQATLLIAGLMMASVALAEGKWWWRSAACLVLATALKPITLPLLLLMAALYRPMIGRLALGIALMAILPSLTQTPSYVQSQYLDCRQMFVDAAEFGNERFYAQATCLLRIAGVPVSSRAMSLVAVLSGGLLLALCLRCRPRAESSRWAIHFYAISMAYLMLFNTRTENSTYAMLGPVLGLCFAQALFQERRAGHATFLGLLAVGVLGSYEIGRMVTGPERAVWLAPLMTIFFAVDVARLLITERPLRVSSELPSSLASQNTESRRIAS